VANKLVYIHERCTDRLKLAVVLKSGRQQQSDAVRLAAAMVTPSRATALSPSTCHCRRKWVEKVNPEQPHLSILFAAGYAACFGGALDFVGKQHKQDASKANVTCAVSIGPREGGGFGLAVSMGVEDKSLAQQELKKLVEEAHAKICPYSHATRGNVDVTFEVVGG
jgi:Ohr subfamily peroxiredoxin